LIIGAPTRSFYVIFTNKSIVELLNMDGIKELWFLVYYLVVQGFGLVLAGLVAVFFSVHCSAKTSLSP